MSEEIKKENSDDTIFNVPMDKLDSAADKKEQIADFLGNSQYVPIFVIMEGETMGQRYILNKRESIVGRRENCEIYILDSLVSRKHSKITITPSDSEDVGFTAVIEDLESMNGTYVNGAKLQGPHLLKDGDKVLIGSVLFCYLTKLREELELENHLLQLAQKDFLTGLFNRAYFSTAIEFEFKRYKRYKNSMSLIIFDLDHFKNINDTYGHDAGDFVLKEIAIILKSIIRSSDLAVRYGGEEFAVLLINTPIEEALTIANRIHAAIKRHLFRYEKIEFNLTASFGLAQLNDDCETVQEVVIKADQALYLAKNSGRDNVQIYKAKPEFKTDMV